MDGFTTNEWIILALVFVAGWLLGLMSRSGGAKYRRQYETERDAHQALRREHDAHMKQHRETVATRDTRALGDGPQPPSSVRTV